jgi:hypothetical protein
VIRQIQILVDGPQQVALLPLAEGVVIGLVGRIDPLVGRGEAAIGI